MYIAERRPAGSIVTIQLTFCLLSPVIQALALIFPFPLLYTICFASFEIPFSPAVVADMAANMAATPRPDIIVAIDFGTTFTGKTHKSLADV